MSDRATIVRPSLLDDGSPAPDLSAEATDDCIDTLKQAMAYDIKEMKKLSTPDIDKEIFKKSVKTMRENAIMAIAMLDGFNNSGDMVDCRMRPQKEGESDMDHCACITRASLASILETSLPTLGMSDDEGENTRVLRTTGLCLLGVPEFVIHFPLSLSGAVMGICQDLTHIAMTNPVAAVEEKLVVGRKVLAARFMVAYEIHDALEGEHASLCPAWHILGSCPLFNFRAVNLVISNVDGFSLKTMCNTCSTMLPKVYKSCPCKAVAYCSKECQRKDWPMHKMMCSTRPSIEALLSDRGSTSADA